VKGEAAAQAEKEKQTPNDKPESAKTEQVKENKDRSRKSRF
jgi:hypothetical protein